MVRRSLSMQALEYYSMKEMRILTFSLWATLKMKMMFNVLILMCQFIFVQKVYLIFFNDMLHENKIEQTISLQNFVINSGCALWSEKCSNSVHMLKHYMAVKTEIFQVILYNVWTKWLLIVFKKLIVKYLEVICINNVITFFFCQFKSKYSK